MMTNLLECINDVLKGTCNLPITALVKYTYFRLVQLFIRKMSVTEAELVSGQVFFQALMRAIEKNRQSIGTMNVSRFSWTNESFVVQELAPIGGWSQRNYRVLLQGRWCYYRYFQALHFPCCLVLTMCAYARVDQATCVDDVYHIQTVFNIYKMKFAPVANESYWPEYHGLIIWQNPELRRATEGRLISTRIRNLAFAGKRGIRRCLILLSSSTNRLGTDN